MNGSHEVSPSGQTLPAENVIPCCCRELALDGPLKRGKRLAIRLRLRSQPDTLTNLVSSCSGHRGQAVEEPSDRLAVCSIPITRWIRKWTAFDLAKRLNFKFLLNPLDLQRCCAQRTQNAVKILGGKRMVWRPNRCDGPKFSR